MKLISFRINGESGYGVVRDDGVVALSGRMNFADLRSLIAANGLAEAAKLAATLKADFKIESAQLLPPIPNPGKIICVGLNYRDHAKEAGLEIPRVPAIFSKFSNIVIGPNEPIILPRISKKPDYEAELAFVIGPGGRNISAEDAWNHVFGYTIVNDVSDRASGSSTLLGCSTCLVIGRHCPGNNVRSIN